MTGLTASTAYQFYVVAVDAAGNASAASAPVVVTTAAPAGRRLLPGDLRHHRLGHRLHRPT